MSGAVPSPAVKHVPVSEAMRAYLARSCTPPDAVLTSLIEKTAALGDQAGMMVPAEQAALLTLLARTVGARTVVDVGTFTGLSALAFARGLAAGGTVITCDVSDEHADLAREHWELAGVADRIDFRLGAAGRTLAALPDGLAADIVFVDADKMNYVNYHALAVPLLRPGGLLIADNVLLDGYVMDPDLAGDALMRSCARKLREFNAALASDDRLDTVMLPIADGLTIARKR
ncbi:O-methyltransferase [Actinomadura sp. NEAU-AAG7]|uniref:O-methyltransferase n=1 Tax=Actinomadura sp. NEAU-AAG7 TaxID=2839640 RepID=UPI0027E06603|nr:O-methyltransferase [Actinomadura sp. NEAU-AAG7]